MSEAALTALSTIGAATISGLAVVVVALMGNRKRGERQLRNLLEVALRHIYRQRQHEINHGIEPLELPKELAVTATEESE